MEEAVNLEKVIKESEFCAVIEVTNGVKKRKIDLKAGQARIARQYIEGINNNIEVLAGILAFRTQIEDADILDYGIDFIKRIPGYEPERAEEALESLAGRDMPPRDKHIANTLYSLVKKGEPLERLLYPADWRAFKKQFPMLGNKFWNTEQYGDHIKHVKGWILERYSALLCASAMPNAMVLGPWNYLRNGLHRDIDVALIGKKEDIIKGLNDPRYFKTVESYSSSFSGSSSPSSFRTSSS